MAGPEVAEIPAVAALLVAMGYFLQWLVASGMLKMWTLSLGKLLVWMADQFDKVAIDVKVATIKPLAALAAMCRSLSTTVEHLLATAAIEGADGASKFFHYFLSLNLWMAREIANLAEDTWHAMKSQAVTNYTDARTYVDGRVFKPIKKETVTIYKTSKAGIQALNLRIGRLEKRVAHMVHAAAVAIPNPWPRVRAAERKIEAQSKRLTRLEKAAIGAGAAAVTITALKRVGLGWLRCSNVTRAGKSVCGMDPNLLETLLLDAAALTVAFNLRTFAEELQDVTGEVAGVIRDWAE